MSTSTSMRVMPSAPELAAANGPPIDAHGGEGAGRRMPRAPSLRVVPKDEPESAQASSTLLAPTLAAMVMPRPALRLGVVVSVTVVVAAATVGALCWGTVFRSTHADAKTTHASDKR